MTVHDPQMPCEMFCTEPIGPDGFDGGTDWKACCPSCDEAMTFLCREVMPAVRRNGYWAPPAASVEDELDAMQRQAGFRPAAADLLTGLLGPEATAALGWGPRADQAYDDMGEAG